MGNQTAIGANGLSIGSSNTSSPRYDRYQTQSMLVDTPSGKTISNRLSNLVTAVRTGSENAAKRKLDNSLATSKLTRELADKAFFNSAEYLGMKKQLDDQMAQMQKEYFEEYGGKLNDKTLSYLQQMSNIDAPTLTAIYTGYKMAEASAAEMNAERMKQKQEQFNNMLATRKMMSDLENAHNTALTGAQQQDLAAGSEYAVDNATAVQKNLENELGVSRLMADNVPVYNPETLSSTGTTAVTRSTGMVNPNVKLKSQQTPAGNTRQEIDALNLPSTQVVEPTTPGALPTSFFDTVGAPPTTAPTTAGAAPVTALSTAGAAPAVTKPVDRFAARREEVRREGIMNDLNKHNEKGGAGHPELYEGTVLADSLFSVTPDLVDYMAKNNLSVNDMLNYSKISGVAPKDIDVSKMGDVPTATDNSLFNAVQKQITADAAIKKSKPEDMATEILGAMNKKVSNDSKLYFMSNPDARDTLQSIMPDYLPASKIKAVQQEYAKEQQSSLPVTQPVVPPVTVTEPAVQPVVPPVTVTEPAVLTTASEPVIQSTAPATISESGEQTFAPEFTKQLDDLAIELSSALPGSNSVNTYGKSVRTALQAAAENDNSLTVDQIKNNITDTIRKLPNTGKMEFMADLASVGDDVAKGTELYDKYFGVSTSQKGE